MSGNYAPSGGTATGSLNSTTVTIAGADVAPIIAGMVIYFGSRTVKKGTGYLIASVVRTDASNGTITLASGLEDAQSSQPFLVDLAQAGNSTTYASFLAARILNAMTEILGLGTTVDNTSKQIVLNSATSGALGRILWEIAGVDQFRIDRRQIGGVEHLAIQSTNDGGTNWVDAILINRTAGTVTFAAAPTFSAPLLLPAGTNLAPALSRTGDTNTGVYFPAADVIGFATGGVHRGQFDALGRLAVGVATATDALHVFPNLRVDGGGGSFIRLAGGNADGASILMYRAGLSNFAAFGQFQGAFFIKNIDTGAIIFTTTSGDVERMRIQAAGNVGIATTNPTTQLHVGGPIRHATYTVATLPAAGTVGAGTRAAVTDANATTFNAIVAGGGSNFVPVISDGTNWRIG
jgi:hypothetical protein